MALYATPADLVERFDIDVIGELATDDRASLSRSDILSHTNVETALRSGSGDIDVSLRVGQRYTPAQLQALDENSNAHLIDIVCTIAMSKLFRRRPGVHAEMAEAIRKDADEYLDKLRLGQNVFGIVEDTSHEESALPQLNGPTSLEIQNRNFLASRLSGHLLPSVASRNPRNRN